MAFSFNTRPLCVDPEVMHTYVCVSDAVSIDVATATSNEFQPQP